MTILFSTILSILALPGFCSGGSFLLPPKDYTWTLAIHHEQVLGYQSGLACDTRPTRDDTMKGCRQAASDRVIIEETGRTYEKRPQVVLTISFSSQPAKTRSDQDRSSELRNPKFFFWIFEKMPVGDVDGLFLCTWAWARAEPMAYLLAVIICCRQIEI